MMRAGIGTRKGGCGDMEASQWTRKGGVGLIEGNAGIVICLLMVELMVEEVVPLPVHQAVMASVGGGGDHLAAAVAGDDQMVVVEE